MKNVMSDAERSRFAEIDYSVCDEAMMMRILGCGTHEECMDERRIDRPAN